jgi:D-alanyl-D-alanine carboxypeptidase (penicillin-binding protein 5/6)
VLAQPLTVSADVRDDDLIGSNPYGSDPSMVPDAPDIKAEYAALCTKDGLVLWERNANDLAYMASITKIMTALVALEESTLDTPMFITYGAANTEGSSAGFVTGDTVLLRDLIIGMLLPSGNDAAVAIAENIAGTEFRFVEKMNAKAVELGMKGTLFSNASGLYDENNYTTAKDLLLLTRAAMANDQFREFVALKEVTLDISGREEYYESTNLLLTQMRGANGVKTGFTDDAGYCLVASAKRNNFEFYAVVLYSTDEDQRFKDAQTLLEWGFAHYRVVELINAAKPVANLACTSWIDKTVPVVASEPVSAILFDYDGPIAQEVKLIEKEGPITQGEVVGSITWTQRNEVIARVDLLAVETVSEPTFWEGIKIWWDRFIGGFSGKPRQASSTTILPPVFDLEIANVNN